MRLFLGISTLLLLIIALGLGAAVYWLTTTRQPYTEPFRPDAPPYAQRGEYTVGVQSFTIEGADRALNGWVWYPSEGEATETVYTEFGGIFETSGIATFEAPPANTAAPYPLIIFSHGSGSSPLLSLFYTEHLASHGFVVIATEHPNNTMIDRIGLFNDYDADVTDNYVYRPQDIRRTIDYALDILNVEDNLAGMIDAENIAVSGHSFGGYTSFAAAGGQLDFSALQNWCDENQAVRVGDVRDESALTSDNRDVLLTGGVCYLQESAERLAELRGLDTVPDGLWDSVGDERISAVLAFAPWNAPIFGETGLANVTVPTLIIVGSNDNTTQPERDARNFYQWVNTNDKMIVELVNGDHSLFIDVCPRTLINFDSYGACSDAVWDLPRAHDLINHISTAFLLSHFYGDSDAATTLDNIEFTGLRVERPW